jgi:hypothetical protein
MRLSRKRFAGAERLSQYDNRSSGSLGSTGAGDKSGHGAGANHATHCAKTPADAPVRGISPAIF